MAILGPVKVVVGSLADYVTEQVTGPLMEATEEKLAEQIAKLDATLTEENSHALSHTSIMGIVGVLNLKNVKDLLVSFKNKLTTLRKKPDSSGGNGHNDNTSSSGNTQTEIGGGNAIKGRNLDELISRGESRSADSVNAEFPEGYSPPYRPGTRITEFVLDGNQTFVRVVSGNSPGGQWIMRQSDIHGLTPEQIADKYALPKVPTGITSITPPKGTRIRVGEVNENFGRPGGGIQFQLMDRVEDGWKNVVPLQ